MVELKVKVCKQILPRLQVSHNVSAHVVGFSIFEHRELAFLPRYWNSRALLDKHRDTLTSSGDLFTSSES